MAGISTSTVSFLLPDIEIIIELARKWPAAWKFRQNGKSVKIQERIASIHVVVLSLLGGNPSASSF